MHGEDCGTNQLTRYQKSSPCVPTDAYTNRKKASLIFNMRLLPLGHIIGHFLGSFWGGESKNETRDNKQRVEKKRNFVLRAAQISKKTVCDYEKYLSLMSIIGRQFGVKRSSVRQCHFDIRQKSESFSSFPRDSSLLIFADLHARLSGFEWFGIFSMKTGWSVTRASPKRLKGSFNQSSLSWYSSLDSQTSEQKV